MLNKSLASLQSVGLPGGCAFGSCSPGKAAEQPQAASQTGLWWCLPAQGEADFIPKQIISQTLHRISDKGTRLSESAIVPKGGGLLKLLLLLRCS